MKTWVQYFHTGTNGKTIEMCGCDGVYVPDGRLGRTRVQKEAIDYAHTRNKCLGKGITHFQLMTGVFSDARSIGPLQRLRTR